MRVLAGHVVDGKVVLDEGTIADGAVVTVLVREKKETFEAPPSEEDELLKRMRRMERGDGGANTGVIEINLLDEERELLERGLGEWGGPAHCTEQMAIALGFEGVEDLLRGCKRLRSILEEKRPMSAVDWARALLAVEVVFASEVLGSGTDWATTTGIRDAEAIAILRRVQRKIARAGVFLLGGRAFGTRRAR